MGVPVAVAVSQLSRPPVMGVAEVHRYLADPRRPGVDPGPAQGHGDPIRLGSRGQVHHGLSQVQPGLGQAHELNGPGRSIGHYERYRVGHADILTGQDDQAAGDEPGVLAGIQHPGQPVEAGVNVGAADALDEGADDVEMLVAAVAQGLGAQRRLGVVHRHPVVAPSDSQRSGHLQAGQGVATVAGRPVHQQVQGVVVGRHLLGGQAPLQQAPHGLRPQGFESEQGGPGHQRGVDLEERVLGGGSDQNQQTRLHRREQGVLLGLVEPVHLVQEQDGAHVAFT